MITDHDGGDECDHDAQIARMKAWITWRVAEQLRPFVGEQLTPEVRRRMAHAVYYVPASSVSITMKLQPTNESWQCSSPHDPGDEDRGVLIRFAHPFGFREVA